MAAVLSLNINKLDFQMSRRHMGTRLEDFLSPLWKLPKEHTSSMIEISLGVDVSGDLGISLSTLARLDLLFSHNRVLQATEVLGEVEAYQDSKGLVVQRS